MSLECLLLSLWSPKCESHLDRINSVKLWHQADIVSSTSYFCHFLAGWLGKVLKFSKPQFLCLCMEAKNTYYIELLGGLNKLPRWRKQHRVSSERKALSLKLSPLFPDTWNWSLNFSHQNTPWEVFGPGVFPGNQISPLLGVIIPPTHKPGFKDRNLTCVLSVSSTPPRVRLNWQHIFVLNIIEL